MRTNSIKAQINLQHQIISFHKSEPLILPLLIPIVQKSEIIKTKIKLAHIPIR